MLMPRSQGRVVSAPQPSRKLPRRALLAATVAAPALVALRPPLDAVAVASGGDAEVGGYRETEHARRFYERARF